MPPITLAFVGLNLENSEISIIEKTINENIEDAFILDGLQRMRTLKRASERRDYSIDMNRPIFVNILLCDSMDKLLYRMITLNNGQKPMTARHQIEIVASNVYDFSGVPVALQTEKLRAKKPIPGAFKQADFIKGYLAFLSKSTNIDNTKIIEEKMDELIADKILETNIADQNIEFTDVINLMAKFTQSNTFLRKWFQNVNNLIGFCSAVGNSFQDLQKTKTSDFESQIQTFETAFEYFDVSKIRVGDVRRKTVSFYIRKYSELKELSDSNLIDLLSQEI